MAGLPIIHGNPTDFEDNTVLRIMLWLAYLRRHDCSRIVVSQSFICHIQDNISLAWVLYDAGFQVIANCSDCCAAEELVHMNVAIEPRCLFHIQTRLYVGILAVWQ